MTVREPEWTQADIDLLVAVREKEPVNSLGIPLSESMDPANQFSFVAPKGPVVDWAEAALGKAQDAYYSSNKDAPRHGHHWRAPEFKP